MDGTICYVNLSTCEEPSDLSVAMADPHWREFMNSEFLAHSQQDMALDSSIFRTEPNTTNGFSKSSARQMGLLTVIRLDWLPRDSNCNMKLIMMIPSARWSNSPQLDLCSLLLYLKGRAFTSWMCRTRSFMVF
jgi:hypothetical protein